MVFLDGDVGEVGVLVWEFLKGFAGLFEKGFLVDDDELQWRWWGRSIMFGDSIWTPSSLEVSERRDTAGHGIHYSWEREE